MRGIDEVKDFKEKDTQEKRPVLRIAKK